MSILRTLPIFAENTTKILLNNWIFFAICLISSLLLISFAVWNVFSINFVPDEFDQMMEFPHLWNITISTLHLPYIWHFYHLKTNWHDFFVNVDFWSFQTVRICLRVCVGCILCVRDFMYSQVIYSIARHVFLCLQVYFVSILV